MNSYLRIAGHLGSLDLWQIAQLVLSHPTPRLIIKIYKGARVHRRSPSRIEGHGGLHVGPCWPAYVPYQTLMADIERTARALGPSPKVTPARFSECLEPLHWSPETTASILGCDLYVVEAWLSGAADVPAKVEAWLESLAQINAPVNCVGWRACLESK